MRSWVESTGDGHSFRTHAEPFYLDDGTGLMLRNTSPQEPGALGAGVHVGFQVKLLGKTPRRSLDDFDVDPD